MKERRPGAGGGRAQRVHPAQEEARQAEQEPEEEVDVDVAEEDAAPTLKPLISRRGLAQEHSGQGGFLARELRSSSSKRW